jgi:hypothetical protein
MILPYTGYEIKLLQKIYRHKIAHLAQPKPLVEIGTDKITCRYDDENLSNHLKVETMPTPQPITAFTLPYPMDFNKIFVISILKLAHDIEDSVLRPINGYWDMLINNTTVDGRPLQDCLDDAMRYLQSQTAKLNSPTLFPLSPGVHCFPHKYPNQCSYQNIYHSLCLVHYYLTVLLFEVPFEDVGILYSTCRLPSTILQTTTNMFANIV